MLVRKILETTLAVGSTSVSFTDSDIPNSLIRVYSTDPDLMPVEQSLTGTTLTITYEAQSSAKGIAVEMVKQGLEIVDNVTSEDTDKALSAKQGKVLKDAIDDIVIPTVPESITDLDDVSVEDIQNNQILAWNSVTEKFENVNQSGGNIHTYSNNEQIIGVWVDGSDIFEKTYSFNSDVAISMTGWTDLNTSIPNDVNFSTFINAWGVDANGTNQGTFLCGLNASNHVQMQSLRNGSGNINVRKIILQYTKTS